MRLQSGAQLRRQCAPTTRGVKKIVTVWQVPIPTDSCLTGARGLQLRHRCSQAMAKTYPKLVAAGKAKTGT